MKVDDLSEKTEDQMMDEINNTKEKAVNKAKKLKLVFKEEERFSNNIDDVIKQAKVDATGLVMCTNTVIVKKVLYMNLLGMNLTKANMIKSISTIIAAVRNKEPLDIKD